VGPEQKEQRPSKRAGKRTDGQEAGRRERAAQLVNVGARLLQAGDAAQALPYLKKAWALDPTEVAAAINLGGAYILLNRHKEAVPILEAAVKLAPDNPMVWLNLGAAYLGNPLLASPAQQEKAIQAFERALELDPTMRHVNYNLGLIFRDRGDYARARAEFARALEAAPDDRDAQKLWEEMDRELAAPSAADDAPSGGGSE